MSYIIGTMKLSFISFSISSNMKYEKIKDTKWYHFNNVWGFFRKLLVGSKSMTTLKDKVNAAPMKPGCYLFKNKFNSIIYVGKSKCLKKRVRQYFQSFESKEWKIKKLVREIYDVEYLITETETDALLLECKLIKHYRPHYNSMMKRERPNAYLIIDYCKDYPGLYISDCMEEGNESVSLGCFYDTNDAENVVGLFNEVWNTPLCKKRFFEINTIKRPCFYFHIGKCSAPCCGYISTSDYNKIINEIIDFFRGSNKVLSDLEVKMLSYSKELDFEKAAVIRNQISLLEKLQSRAKRFHTDLKEKDYCIFLRAYNELCFSIFYIHDGIVLSRITLSINKEINQKDLKEFCSDIMQENYNVADGEILSSCIIAISADKYYVDITDYIKGKLQEQLISCLQQHYKEFLNDSNS